MSRKRFTHKDRARIFTANEIAAFAVAIDYDPTTGAIIWKVPPRFSGIKTGDTVGSLSRGYWRVKIAGRSILCHRIAWALFYGKDAGEFLDHINGITADNRIANLRLASRSDNAKNRAPNTNAQVPLKGVTFHASTGKYRARIRVNTKLISLGLYPTAEAAHAAYSAAAAQHFGQFARGVSNAC